MLGLAMLSGGRTTFRTRILLNTTTWVLPIDAPDIPNDQPLLLLIEIGLGVTVQSTVPVTPAMWITGLADGSEVHLINRGTILGGEDFVGASGGTALKVDHNGPLYITNASGLIYGGLTAFPGIYGDCVDYTAGYYPIFYSGISRIRGAISA